MADDLPAISPRQARDFGLVPYRSRYYFVRQQTEAQPVPDHSLSLAPTVLPPFRVLYKGMLNLSPRYPRDSLPRNSSLPTVPVARPLGAAGNRARREAISPRLAANFDLLEAIEMRPRVPHARVSLHHMAREDLRHTDTFPAFPLDQMMLSSVSSMPVLRHRPGREVARTGETPAVESRGFAVQGEPMQWEWEPMQEDLPAQEKLLFNVFRRKRLPPEQYVRRPKRISKEPKQDPADEEINEKMPEIGPRKPTLSPNLPIPESGLSGFGGSPIPHFLPTDRSLESAEGALFPTEEDNSEGMQGSGALPLSREEVIYEALGSQSKNESFRGEKLKDREEELLDESEYSGSEYEEVQLHTELTESHEGSSNEQSQEDIPSVEAETGLSPAEVQEMILSLIETLLGATVAATAGEDIDTASPTEEKSIPAEPTTEQMIEFAVEDGLPALRSFSEAEIAEAQVELPPEVSPALAPAADSIPDSQQLPDSSATVLPALSSALPDSSESVSPALHSLQDTQVIERKPHEATGDEYSEKVSMLASTERTNLELTAQVTLMEIDSSENFREEFGQNSSIAREEGTSGYESLLDNATSIPVSELGEMGEFLYEEEKTTKPAKKKKLKKNGKSPGKGINKSKRKGKQKPESVTGAIEPKDNFGFPVGVIVEENPDEILPTPARSRQAENLAFEPLPSDVPFISPEVQPVSSDSPLDTRRSRPRKTVIKVAPTLSPAAASPVLQKAPVVPRKRDPFDVFLVRFASALLEMINDVAEEQRIVGMRDVQQEVPRPVLGPRGHRKSITASGDREKVAPLEQLQRMAEDRGKGRDRRTRVTFQPRAPHIMKRMETLRRKKTRRQSLSASEESDLSMRSEEALPVPAEEHEDITRRKQISGMIEFELKHMNMLRNIATSLLKGSKFPPEEIKPASPPPPERTAESDILLGRRMTYVFAPDGQGLTLPSEQELGPIVPQTLAALFQNYRPMPFQSAFTAQVSHNFRKRRNYDEEDEVQFPQKVEPDHENLQASLDKRHFLNALELLPDYEAYFGIMAEGLVQTDSSRLNPEELFSFYRRKIARRRKKLRLQAERLEKKHVELRAKPKLTFSNLDARNIARNRKAAGSTMKHSFTTEDIAELSQDYTYEERVYFRMKHSQNESFHTHMHRLDASTMSRTLEELSQVQPSALT